MSKPLLQDLFNLPDVLLLDNFEFYFTAAPLLQDQDIRNMRVQTQTVGLPGRNIEPADVMLFGYQIEFGGRNTTDHTMNIAFIETRALVIHRALTNWTEQIRNRQVGVGVSKVNYAGRAILNMLSEGGQIAAQWTFINIWPNVMPEITYDGGQTGVMQVSCQFKFDEFLPTNLSGAGVTSQIAA